MQLRGGCELSHGAGVGRFEAKIVSGQLNSSRVSNYRLMLMDTFTQPLQDKGPASDPPTVAWVTIGAPLFFSFSSFLDFGSLRPSPEKLILEKKKKLLQTYRMKKCHGLGTQRESRKNKNGVYSRRFWVKESRHIRNRFRRKLLLLS